MRDFPGCAVDRNLPANAGDMGSILDSGKFHMPWSNMKPESIRSIVKMQYLIKFFYSKYQDSLLKIGTQISHLLTLSTEQQTQKTSRICWRSRSQDTKPSPKCKQEKKYNKTETCWNRGNLFCWAIFFWTVVYSGFALGLRREEITTELDTDTKKKRNPQVWHWNSPEINSLHRRSDFLIHEKYYSRPGGRWLGEGYFLSAKLPTLEEPLYNIPVNVKWCSCCGKQFDCSSKS